MFGDEDRSKETRGCCKLKEEVLDRTLWTTCFGRCYWPVVRHTIEWTILTTRHSNVCIVGEFHSAQTHWHLDSNKLIRCVS
jgi:hypothetical protein